MENPVFKKKYQKYKLRVKIWEKDFKKKHGRIPSKYDIREAPHDIKDSYKMYYKLKTAFLEDTLNGILSDDGFDVLEMSQNEIDMDVSITENTNLVPQLPLDVTRLVEHNEYGDHTSQANCSGFSNTRELPSSYAQANFTKRNEIHVLKEFEPVKELSLNSKAWNADLGMKPEKNCIKEIERKCITRNFNEKLFKNSSFSKRNPRKSFSKSVVDKPQSNNQRNNDTDTISISGKIVLPDLETILLQKAKEQQSAGITSTTLLTVDNKKENIKTQVDEGWLERNTIKIDIKSKENVAQIEDNKINSVCKISRKAIYGLTNINLSSSKTEPKNLIEPQSKLQEINQITVNSNLNTSSIELNNVGLAPLQKSNTFHARVMSCDSDSVIDESEEEEKESFASRHIVKRRKILKSSTLKVQIDTHRCISEKSKTSPHLENNVNNCKHILNKNRREQDYELKRPKSRAKHTFAKNSLEKTVKGVISKESKMSHKDKKVKTSAKGSKKKVSNCEELLDTEVEDKPIDPEDLKYTLALESGNLTSIPRIKQTDLDSANSLVQKYISSVAPITLTAMSLRSTPLTEDKEKRDAARRKLEDKIAAGKLNENFVTINIQKKTFVRGKKNIIYSKYKKKLWKHKKHIAALSGPNMNMSGCDGGILKCFTCGQSGHFAQNCKIKGDSLLPLTVPEEADDSPFPTLEEAERMASQSAVAVHSSNISKMPSAANPAIYNQTADGNNDENLEEEVNLSTPNIDIDSNISEKFPYKEYLIDTCEELGNLEIDAISFESQKVVSPTKKIYVGSRIPDSFLKAAGIDSFNANSNPQFSVVDPIYDLNADGSVKEVTSEVSEVLKMFGHRNFRKGQDRAVMRILSGKSTLVTLSTGSGKSLCYQLPAYLYSKHRKSITLVISPLVSLMEDQVTGIPHFLRAHCLHTNQTPQQKVKILKIIADGDIDVLLISPEAVVAGERSTGFGSILRQLPPIAFACIDEAHCVSQWSHNFRPSYLMICKVLRENLGIKCVLGLTATATFPTRMSIINHLRIMDGERGVISDVPLPDNLVLSASKDENRDSALLQLLLSQRFQNCQSIVIYCTRRDECERIAAYLRTCLQGYKTMDMHDVKNKRKRLRWHAEPYHAGMPASRRRTIQSAFMSNELRIVVATVAFGMGINKPDIRAVIHYNMPRNFESYVQEVGRAGRDNKTSHCHLFLDANGDDQNELRRHIYANSLDRHVIRKLLQHVFVPCSCDKNLKSGMQKCSEVSDEALKKVSTSDDQGLSEIRRRICQGHEIGFSIQKTVEILDIPEENISTLLCYMELDNRWSINVLSNAYMKVKVISYNGPKNLKHAAKQCPPLAMAIALEIKNGSFKEDSNIIEFSVVDIAAAIGWNSGVVKYHLKNLEWVQVNGYPKRSAITVTFFDLGFRIKAPGDFTMEEIDDALDSLYSRSVKQEHTQLIQLQYIWQGLSSVAYNTHGPCCTETFSHDRSNQLKSIIRDYFHNDYPKNLKLQIDPSNVPDAELESDVISLINMYPENNFSGRNIARIFHGISSPNYPAVVWHRCKFWRVHCKANFNHIVQLANNVIVRRRT